MIPDIEEHPDPGTSEATYKGMLGWFMRRLRYDGTTIPADELREMRLANVQVTPQKNGDVIVTVD